MEHYVTIVTLGQYLKTSLRRNYVGMQTFSKRTTHFVHITSKNLANDSTLSIGHIVVTGISVLRRFPTTQLLYSLDIQLLHEVVHYVY